MKKLNNYLFLVIPLVMVAAMLFPARVYAQSGTTPDVPTVPTAPGSTGSTVSDISSSSAGSAPSAATCTSSGVYGDPTFKVGLVTYYFLLNGSSCPLGSTLGVNCFVSLPGASPIQDAINWINGVSGLLPSDRKIYVEAGTYTGTVTLAGTSINKIANLVGLIGHGSADTTIAGPVSISGTKAGFTLSGFSIAGAPGGTLVSFNNNLGALTLSDLTVTNFAGGGIAVSSHQGSITLSGVMASNNSGSGAILNNAGYLTAYPVTITNSEFDDNTTSSPVYGLAIYSKGLVTLNGISASRNRGYGLTVEAGSMNIKNGFFSDNLNYNVGLDGWGTNLKTGSLGSITLDNIFTNFNQGEGMVIDANGGAVTISNLEASHNLYGGLLIGSPSVLPGAVKVTNAEVNYNSRGGIQIYSKSSVTLDTVDAYNTYAGGNLFIDNCAWNGAKCLGNGLVTISSKVGGYFYNSGSGPAINIISGNKVSLSDFITYGNIGPGVLIDNTHSPVYAGVTISSTLPAGWLNASNNAPAGAGVQINSNGFVSVNRLQASGNTSQGLLIYNYTSPVSAGVEVKNSEFNHNHSDAGLSVLSKGSIAITNVSASNNTGYGVHLDNIAGTAGVSILPAVGVQYPNFGYNSDYAIRVDSKGAVTVKGVNVNYNPVTGIYIDNCVYVGGTCIGNGTVTVSDVNVAYTTTSNESGIVINSKGAITLNNVTANANAGNGISLYNSYTPTISPVTVMNSYISSNDLDGLFIYSKGNVTLTSISSNYNGTPGVYDGAGVYIDNCQQSGGVCSGNGSVTVNGVGNEFFYNAGEGLEAYSKGNMTISNIDVENNGSYGLLLYGLYTNSAGNITVTSSTGFRNLITSNGFGDPTHQTLYSGLAIQGQGNILVEKTDANWNGSYGMYLENSGALLPKTLTVRESSATLNQYGGIIAHAFGSATLQNSQGLDNTMYLAPIQMDSAFENLLISSENRFYFNGTIGQAINIEVRSNDFDAVAGLYNSSDGLLATDDNSGGGTNAKIGPFTLTATGLYYIKVTSNTYGGQYAVMLYTSGAPIIFNSSSSGIDVSATGSLSVLTTTGGLGTYGSGNAAYGVLISSSGNVTAAALGGNYNSYAGVRVVNFGTPGASVTLNGGTANGNHYGNYEIYSAGQVTVTGVTAGGSETSAGIYIDNSLSTAHHAVTVTNVNTEYNSLGDGLHVESKGNITLNGIHSHDNATGASLDNSSYSLARVTILGTSRVNTIFDNDNDGLDINAGGPVSIDKVTAYSNGHSGIGVTAGTTLTLTNLRLYYNSMHGIEAYANGLVTINNLQSINNGTGTPFTGYGILLHLSSDPVTFANSLFIGNHSAGIRVYGGSTYSIVSTSFYGNNINNTAGVFNFMWNVP